MGRSGLVQPKEGLQNAQIPSQRNVVDFNMLRTSKGRFLIACAVATGVAVVVSHALVFWLGIETRTGRPWIVRSKSSSAIPAFICGSSLAGDGIGWGQVSEALQLNLTGWGVAGSSPWEWEAFQEKANKVKASFIIVSAYDLNEHFLCDFHATVVSPAVTIRDLYHSGSNWGFAKRILSQYPLRAIRVLFPTAGRSQGVMAGVRDKIAAALGRKGSSERGPSLNLGKNDPADDGKSGNITQWSRARVLRRVSQLRTACGGRQDFSGPKQTALIRMLQHAKERGKTTVILLPVSESYTREFINDSVRDRFEEAIAAAQRRVSGVQWVRLDKVPGLGSDDHFWDLVHMNHQGKELATRALLQECDSSQALSQAK